MPQLAVLERQRMAMYMLGQAATEAMPLEEEAT